MILHVQKMEKLELVTKEKNFVTKTLKTPEAKKRPITKLVQINAQTGEPYSDEDPAFGKDFCMKVVVVGYEEISQSESYKG